jgi:hypothetical protein
MVNEIPTGTRLAAALGDNAIVWKCYMHTGALQRSHDHRRRRRGEVLTGTCHCTLGTSPQRAALRGQPARTLPMSSFHEGSDGTF